MKRKAMALWLGLMLLLSLSLSMPVLAEITGAGPAPRLMDQADLLTDAEEKELLSLLNEISLRQEMDVVVVTVYSLEGESPMVYADDFFDYGGYGQGSQRSGVLLLHSPQQRDWWITTRGEGIEAFTDAGIQYIGEQIKPFLAQGENKEAYETFARQCDAFITQAKTGEPFDVDSLPREPLSWVAIPICLVLGLFAALAVVAVLKSQLDTVRGRREADHYIRPGSMNLTSSRELFLYRNVSRVAKPKQNSGGGGSSTHRSSSGARHGGGGGKY